MLATIFYLTVTVWDAMRGTKSVLDDMNKAKS